MELSLLMMVMFLSSQGMFMDGIVKPDESVGDNNHYDAREDPLNTTSPFKEVVLYRLTGTFVGLPQTVKCVSFLNGNYR